MLLAKRRWAVLLHAFTRDPNSYLLGVYGGYVDAGSANVWYIGPEAELYLDNISIEAVGGYMDISNGVGSEFYAMGKVALYATRQSAPVSWRQQRCRI